MAIILLGRSKCSLCEKTIEERDEIVAFTHFVLNEADPLYRFSDAAFHKACFQADPLSPSMVAATEHRRANDGPGKRTCAVCGEEARDPDDYLLIGYLGDPDAVPIGKFNYTHLHKSHISVWKQAREFLILAKVAIGEKRWRGAALDDMAREVEARL